MEIVVSLMALVAFATGARMLWSTDARAGPAGLFRGLFGSQGLDWPTGVQEEDRDRLWSWADPPEPVDPAETEDELVDLSVGAVPVRPVR